MIFPVYGIAFSGRVRPSALITPGSAPAPLPYRRGAAPLPAFAILLRKGRSSNSGVPLKNAGGEIRTRALARTPRYAAHSDKIPPLFSAEPRMRFRDGWLRHVSSPSRNHYVQSASQPESFILAASSSRVRRAKNSRAWRLINPRRSPNRMQRPRHLPFRKKQ